MNGWMAPHKEQPMHNDNDRACSGPPISGSILPWLIWNPPLGNLLVALSEVIDGH